MSFTHYPHGASSFGIPLVGAGILSVPNRNGTVWFVDTDNGSDGNGGTDPDFPLKTIAKAIAKAGDGTGDTIYVFPGSYDESLAVSKDYLAILGATFAGYAKPDISGQLVVTGQGFMARHARFTNSDDVVVQKGNGFLYEDCVLDGDGNGAGTSLLWLLPSDTDDSLTASEGLVKGCLLRGSGGTAIKFDTGLAPVGVGTTDNQILGNVLVGNTGVDIVTADQGSGLYSVQRTLIAGNFFMDKNKATYIDLTTTNGGAASDQNGAIDGNYFASDTITTTKIKMVGTGFTFSGNLDTVGVVDGSGLD